MSLSMDAGREAQHCSGTGSLHIDHKHKAVSATGNGVSLLKAQSSTQRHISSSKSTSHHPSLTVPLAVDQEFKHEPMKAIPI